MDTDELIDQIALDAGLTRAQVEYGLSLIQAKLKELAGYHGIQGDGETHYGHPLRLQYFGTFHPQYMPPRFGRNPQTGLAEARRAIYRVRFWPGIILKKIANGEI
jgi:nucleoid DNA-binding protein